MKPGFATLLLSLVPAWCQVAKPVAVIASSNLPVTKAARIPQDAMKDLERTFNYRIANLADVNEPMELMGDFRAIQLEDFGVVVTSEVSLVVTPGLMPGRPKIPPELAAKVHKQRVDRLPLLKTGMKEMMRNMAAAFSQVPAGQQMVLVVRLWYGPWEDTTGMPAQVIMRADRASAAAGKVETEER